jgi:hypothetical protein
VGEGDLPCELTAEYLCLMFWTDGDLCIDETEEVCGNPSEPGEE